MGGSKKVTVGYWYRVLYHAGLCKGPIDKFLEFRGGDKTAWEGQLTASGTITIDAPWLWGGEKDQGGIAGDVDVMFGEADQLPSGYLQDQLGEQIPAWRGIATLVFKGGRYGAMNPYPRPASYKVRKIKEGWDDGCWYPDRACVWPPGQLPAASEAVCILDSDATLLRRTGGMHPTPVNNSGNTWATLITEDSLSASILSGYAPVDPTKAHMFVTNYDGTVATVSSYRMKYDPGGQQVHNLEMRVMVPDGTVHTIWPGSFFSSGVPPYTGSTEAQMAVSAQAASRPYVIPPGPTHFKLWYPLPSWPLDSLAGTHDFSVYEVDFESKCHYIYPDGPWMNPAHILYYSRTNSDMGRESVEVIDDTSLRAAANWFFDRGVGFCTKRDPSSESPAEFEKRIARVAGCSFSRSLADGKWYIDIANGEYDIDALPILTDDDILEFKEQPSTLDNAINSVSVRYFDVERKEAVTTPPVRALGLIAAFGTIHQTYEFPEIAGDSLAMIVAMRELIATATPTRAFELVTNRKPYTWRANQYFRLQAPKRGIADMVCIVGEIETGSLRSGAIKLKAVQDVYSLPDTVYVEQEPGVDTRPPQTPTVIAVQRVMEAPYIDVVAALSAADLDILDEEAGFLIGLAVEPAESVNFTMRVKPGVSGTYVDVAEGEFCPTALVVGAATHLDTALTLSDGDALASVEIGTVALWDNEICRVDAIDVGAGTISLGRGCADTVPAAHAAGSRLWFYQVGAAVDTTEYTAGETVNVKLLSNTGSQQLAESAATPMSLTFDQRQMRPYPPGRLRLNGTAYPSSVSGALTVTWAHRDRVLQADQLIDTTATSIGPEINTRYTLQFYDASNALIIQRTNIGLPTAVVVLAYTGNVTLKLWAVSDAGASLQMHEFTFGYTPPGGASSINATDYVPYSPTWEIDGNGG